MNVVAIREHDEAALPEVEVVEDEYSHREACEVRPAPVWPVLGEYEELCGYHRMSDAELADAMARAKGRVAIFSAETDPLYVVRNRLPLERAEEHVVYAAREMARRAS